MKLPPTHRALRVLLITACSMSRLAVSKFNPAFNESPGFFVGTGFRIMADFGAMLAPLAAELRKRFRRGGEPVFDSTNYRPEWNKASYPRRPDLEEKRVRLGDGGARIHDCRVSGAINLLDAGVDESTVLKIGGWKTRAMLATATTFSTVSAWEVLSRRRVSTSRTESPLRIKRSLQDTIDRWQNTNWDK